ncbi:MAG: hypothetical protein AB8G17_04915 [Gammaproteobacteria bacterium]
MKTLKKRALRITAVCAALLPAMASNWPLPKAPHHGQLGDSVIRNASVI